MNVLLNWHLRVFAKNNRHQLPTHTFQTPGFPAAPKYPVLPSPCLWASVHAVPSAGTLPCLPASVPPCDPAWVSPGLSSTPGALQVAPSLLDLCAHHTPSCHCSFTLSPPSRLGFLQVGLLFIAQCPTWATLKRYLLNNGNREAGKEEITWEMVGGGGAVR